MEHRDLLDEQFGTAHFELRYIGLELTPIGANQLNLFGRQFGARIVVAITLAVHHGRTIVRRW